MIRRHIFLVTAVIGLLLAGSNTSQLTAQTSPEGPEAGQELAVALRTLRPAEDLKWRGTLKILGREPKVAPVIITCQTTLGETNWSVVYQAEATASSGAERFAVIFSTNAPNQYFYARAASPGAPLGAPQELSGAQADIPLGGSDIWLSDLGYEFCHWPGQTQRPGEMRHGRPCYVLESTNPHPAKDGYSRVVTWVEKESGQPLHAEAYDANKKLYKEFELGSVVKVNGHYELKDLKMFNRKTGSRTYLDFDLPGP